MKIAIYYDNPYKTGGIERGMLNFARNWSKKGHDITYLFNNKFNIDYLIQMSEFANVKQLNYCPEHYDIVIYEKYNDTPFIDGDKKGLIVNGNVMDWHENFKLNLNFDFYVAVGKECAEQFKQTYGIDCQVIPNYIHIPDKIEKLELKRARYNFITVSRIDDFKGFDKMLKIAELLDKNNIDYYWYCVGGNTGDSKTAERIKDQFKKYERFIFVGEQLDPYPYMKNADTLVQTSRTESQCISFCEAKDMGLRTITTDWGTAHEYGSDYILKQDLSNLNLEELLSNKKSKFTYPNLDELWKPILKPIEKVNHKFTVIIPNFNNSKFLDKCLTSVLNQTYKNIDIVFIDDVSTDNSLDIAHKLLDNTKHKIFVNDKKRWNGGSRNVGIEYAKQTNPDGYILYLDSDDWLYSDDCIEKINSQLRNEDVGFLNAKAWNGTNYFWELNPNVKDMLEAFKAEASVSCASWAKVTKVSKTPYFCENTLMEDRVWHYRLINNCNSFKNINVVYNVFNRTNTSSVCTQRNSKWNNSAYRHIADMLDLLDELKDPQYISYVKYKIDLCKNSINQKIYKQL
jgi:glycosyltransferase involved in cell wall biosynthesis